MLTEEQLRRSQEAYRKELQEAGITGEDIREGRRKLIRHTAGNLAKRFGLISLKAIGFYLFSLLVLMLIEKYLIHLNLRVFLLILFLFGFWSGYWVANRKWWRNLGETELGSN